MNRILLYSALVLLLYLVYGLIPTYADCTGEPDVIAVPIRVDTGEFGENLNTVEIFGECNYELVDAGSQFGKFDFCWSDDFDTKPVYCEARYEKATPSDPVSDTFPTNAHAYINPPGPGCGTYSSLASGDVSFCVYDGERNDTTGEQEVPSGWREESPGVVLPGEASDGTDILPAEPDNLGIQTECPDGYEPVTGSTTLCQKTVLGGGFFTNPNSLGPEGDGASGEGDTGGTDICADNPDILACEQITPGNVTDAVSPDLEEVATFGETLTDFTGRVEASPIISSIANLNFTPNAEVCPTFSFTFPVVDWTDDMTFHCTLFENHRTEIGIMMTFLFSMISVFILLRT